MKNFIFISPAFPGNYENFCVARWFDEDGVQYNLYAENVTLDEFKTVYGKVK